MSNNVTYGRPQNGFAFDPAMLSGRPDFWSVITASFCGPICLSYDSTLTQSLLICERLQFTFLNHTK